MMMPVLSAIGVGAFLPDGLAGQTLSYFPIWLTDLIFALAAVRIAMVGLTQGKAHEMTWKRDIGLWATAGLVAYLIMALASRVLPSGWGPMHDTVLATGPLMPVFWGMFLWWPAYEMLRSRRGEAMALLASVVFLFCAVTFEAVMSDGLEDQVTAEVIPVLDKDGKFHDLDGLMQVVASQSVLPLVKEAWATGKVGPYEGAMVGVRSTRMMVLARTDAGELNLTVQHPVMLPKSNVTEALTALGVITFFAALLSSWRSGFRQVFGKTKP